MGVAKMEHLNIKGPTESLLPVLGRIAKGEYFAPESGEAIHSAIRFSANRYEPLLTKAKGLLQDLGQNQPEGETVFEGGAEAYDLETVSEYLEKFAGQVSGINQRRILLTNQLDSYTKTEGLLLHLTEMDVDFEELFRVGYLKIRIGRLPKSSLIRLAYYKQKEFNFANYFDFIVYDFDGENYWGIYFAPRENAKEIDDIFASLYFERIWVPEFVHGKPLDALQGIRESIRENQKSLDELVHPKDIAAEQDITTIQRVTRWLDYMNQLFEMQRYVTVFNDTFYISGFVSKGDRRRLEDDLTDIPGVFVQQEAAASQDINVAQQVPVRLKNNWFARPYEMFTTMYGMPSYRDIDPTFLVSILYSVLFGLMFADMGQGLVLGLFGYFYLYKKRGMAIGAILARAGLFSTIFGFLFGSVFGDEHLLDPLWHAMGMEEKPFEVMGAQNVNFILVLSLAIGIFMIILAILLSIFSQIRRQHLGTALTGPNGVAGLVFYCSTVLLVLDMMALGIGFSKNPLYIVVLIVLPVLIMYLHEPLSEIIEGRGLKIHSWSDVLVGGFFDLFVTVLDYLANTVSFLRVGGFIWAHAGMMSVVGTLASMSSGAGSVAVMIVGNLVVIGLEGLIVGIQALRLNYYEFFSRFFEAGGIPFRALSLRRLSAGE